MTTPFDKAIAAIARLGYHNHRLEEHSDTVSTAIMEDLLVRCVSVREDVEVGAVQAWRNISSPGDRLRKVDLFVGEPGRNGGPDINKVRIAIENKSVITAHRNRTNRFDDLQKVLGAIHSARPEAILIATVLVGLADRVLNVPDHVKKKYRTLARRQEFETRVRPRLSTGDQRLWTEFEDAVSDNRPNDPARTVALMRTLPIRQAGHTHVAGYDFVLLVPVMIDNVNPPSLPRPNPLDIDVDVEYRRMLDQICAAYTARWHT